MAFTDNCVLFAPSREDGVNRVIAHVMRQRPSWFNCATADVAGKHEPWWKPIQMHDRASLRTLHGSKVVYIG